jgi:hypothetical protein
LVEVLTGVFVGGWVGALVLVAVGGTGVFVGVFVGLLVAVGVGVGVLVGVNVGGGVRVGVDVAVLVGVGVLRLFVRQMYSSKISSAGTGSTLISMAWTLAKSAGPAAPAAVPKKENGMR